MSNKRIVFTEPYVAKLLDVDMPTPAAGQVVVKLVRSSISAGTERANLVGDPNVDVSRAGQVIYPRYTGYSSAGEVVAVGEGDAVESFTLLLVKNDGVIILVQGVKILILGDA